MNVNVQREINGLLINNGDQRERKRERIDERESLPINEGGDV